MVTPPTSDSAQASIKTSQSIMAEYLWLGGNGPLDIRCKTKVLGAPVSSASELPEWNYDGSSCNQAPGKDSEVLIIPRAIYPDPIRNRGSILVICDTYNPHTREPLPTNTRAPAAKIFEELKHEECWFGIEQEYTLFKDGTPLGWPKCSARSPAGPSSQLGYPGPQGPYYCSVGSDVAFGRDLVEDHMTACIDAGVQISGINAEVMPGQWEFQVGPCEGISAGDDLMIARYLILRLSEKYNIQVSFDPKPVAGDWNGAGCHTNFSTKSMREDGGIKYIQEAIERLGKKHAEHIAQYGSDNHLRLTGLHETSSMDKFSYGVADRGASVRIPNSTRYSNKGYFEDRRPSSNMDGYTVTSLIAHTSCTQA